MRRLPSLGGPWRVGVLALLWGSNYLWIKLADRGLSPVEVTLTRLGLGAAVLLILVAIRRERLPTSATAWVHITVAALLGNALPYLLFAVGEQTANSSTAGIINATAPLWTIVIALATRHQRTLRLCPAVGLAAGFAGAILIFTPWRSGPGFATTGAAVILAAAVSYGLSYVYMDRFVVRRDVGPMALSACQLAVSTVMLAITLAATGAATPRLNTITLTSVVVLGIVGTGIAYVLNYQIITSEGATVASTVTYLLPVVAIILGILALNEHVGITEFVGIAVILAGVALTRRGNKRQPEPVPDDLLQLSLPRAFKGAPWRAGPDGLDRV